MSLRGIFLTGKIVPLTSTPVNCNPYLFTPHLLKHPLIIYPRGVFITGEGANR